MISYWKNVTTVHVDDGMTLITGWYDHKNKDGGGYKALGVHWDGYPQSRGVLSPCVIPEQTRIAILSGLLQQAVTVGNIERINNLIAAIEFFNEKETV